MLKMLTILGVALVAMAGPAAAQWTGCMGGDWVINGTQLQGMSPNAPSSTGSMQLQSIRLPNNEITRLSEPSILLRGNKGRR